MQQFINNWSAELSAPATASAVQLSVPPAAAALLTGLGSGGYYLLTLVQVADGAETAWEIVRVTANAAGVLSVARGQEGTAAQAWAAGALIEARLTQASMEALRDAAASAVQPGDLAPVATSGAYADLDGLPTIPSTAAEVGAIPAAEKGAASGVATLDAGGKVPLAQVPAAAITNTSVVNTEAAMLALTAQVGDVAIRPDISSSFILQAEPASTLANWQQIITPAVGGGAPVGSATPQALGAASPGISSNASREDHVHQMPSAADVGADAAGTAAGALAAHTAAGDPHSQYEKASNKGAASGYAPLDASQKVPAVYLPSFVDDVIEAANFAALPASGESGKIYVTLNDNKSWRWSGSAYVEISASPGSTDAVPEGATNKYFTEGRVLATILAGLDLATGTVISAADSVLSALGKLQKQISDAVSAIAGKQDTLVSGTNLKTVNGSSLLGAGNLSISGPQVVAYAGTGRNLDLTDINTIVDCTSGSAVTITIPPQSSVSWQNDAEIHVRMSGTGLVSIAGGAGVTAPPIALPVSLSGQGAVVTLKRRSSDVWAIVGSVVGGPDVVGPASAVDNEIPRFDGTTGKKLKAGLKYQASQTDTTTGALLINGAYGLGPMAGAISSGDMNDLGTATEFALYTSAVVNLPTLHNYYVLHIKSTGSAARQQIAFRQSTGQMYTRSYNGTTWTAWEERWGSLSANAVAVDTGSIGYGTGSGGTVTQATSKSTGVTLNKPTGRITTHDAALAAGASVTFTVTNNKVGSDDNVIVNTFTGFLNYRVEAPTVGGGSFTIRLTNISGGSLSEAVQIKFTVIKGAIA